MNVEKLLLFNNIITKEHFDIAQLYIIFQLASARKIIFFMFKIIDSQLKVVIILKDMRDIQS